MKNTIFWDATLSSLIEVYRRSLGIYCYYLQDRNKVRTVTSPTHGVSHAIFRYILKIYKLVGPDPEEGDIKFL